MGGGDKEKDMASTTCLASSCVALTSQGLLKKIICLSGLQHGNAMCLSKHFNAQEFEKKKKKTCGRVAAGDCYLGSE